MDHIIGILHIKDVVTRYVRPGRLNVANLLRPIVRVPDSMPADRLLAFLREQRSHQAIVVDAGGTMVGLITLEDVVAELLGGVADEFKAAPLRSIRLSDGRLRLPGQMRLDQAAPLIGKAWTRQRQGGARMQADTIGAYVTEWLQRVPEPGEEVVIDGTPAEIESVEGGVVTSVIAGERPTPGADETK
jgi:CBS domain containing-hemolysin-like protein